MYGPELFVITEFDFILYGLKKIWIFRNLNLRCPNLSLFDTCDDTIIICGDRHLIKYQYTIIITKSQKSGDRICLDTNDLNR